MSAAAGIQRRGDRPSLRIDGRQGQEEVQQVRDVQVRGERSMRGVLRAHHGADTRRHGAPGRGQERPRLLDGDGMTVHYWYTDTISVEISIE